MKILVVYWILRKFIEVNNGWITHNIILIHQKINVSV